MKRRILLTCLQLLLFSLAVAQNVDALSGYGIEVNPVYGKVLKHNYIFPPVPSSSYAIDINILKQTTGNKEWQVQRKFPLLGVGFTYTDYGIDSVYGKCYGLYPVWELPIVRGEQLEWTCRFGYGIGYVTKHYERYPTFDTLNNLIGSNINNFTMFTTQLRYKVNEHIHIHTGFNFSHISNGSFQLPNLGVNMYGGHIGLRYFPVTDHPPKTPVSVTTLPNRWLFQLRVGLGMNEYNNVDGPRYPVYSASVYASKRYASKNKISGGIDYNYYKAMEYFLKNNEIMVGEEADNAWQGAIFIGHEFVIGKVGIITQLGVPFKHTAINKELTIQKLGYSYYVINQEQGILKELTVNALIKSDNLEASNLELSIGAGF